MNQIVRKQVLQTPSLFLKAGFTLIEMAIVLVILATLLSSGVLLLGARVEQQRVKDSQKVLEDAKEALIGFAAANGRLPCPATSTSNGLENPVGGGVCTNPYDGLLPAVTLGLPGVDAGGYLPDAWQTNANRIRYAVTTANSSAATTANGIRTTTMANFAPDLFVCLSATGIGASCGSAANTLSNNAVAVIYSLGKNAPTGGTGLDEAANLNANAVFVSHTPTSVGAANGEFDDLMTWFPSSLLFNRLLQAGRLP